MMRIQQYFALSFVVLLPIIATAYDFEVDGIYYIINNGTTASVTFKSNSGYEYFSDYCGDVVIPETVTYDGTTYSVTSIASSAFYGCSELTSIYIPTTVTSIGSQAFYRCSGLKSINIPETVTYITFATFDGCSGLTSIIIPNSVTSIGMNAFFGCLGLTSINLPNSVTSIGVHAFYGCSGLTSINIPNSVTSIGASAFFGCSGLTSISIPNSVTSIGNSAFARCSGLTSIMVDSGNSYFDSRNNCNAINETASNSLIAGCKNTTIPNSVTSIGSNAFDGCSGLSGISIPNSVTTIDNDAFEGCSGLTSIEIPNSVTLIGNSAFSGCTALASIIIPNSVTNIGKWAFSNCRGLTSITIPSSVSIIDEYAFNCCTELISVIIGSSATNISNFAFRSCNRIMSIYCFATEPPECNDNAFPNYSAMLHVPAASLAAYFTAPIWSNFGNIVGNAVEPTGITISKDSVEMPVCEQFVLTATVTPANASFKEVTWYSTDTSVATVHNGTVTSVGYGECDIFAYCMGMPAICHISVTNRITLDQQEAMLLPNHMLTLTPSAPAMPDGFTVTSSDPTVAAARVMNGKVQVVGIKEGIATITVSSADGTAISATCLVTVYTELGDLNSDGFINISDVTALISFILTNDESLVTIKNADINHDGKINVSDVTMLISTILDN